MRNDHVLQNRKIAREVVVLVDICIVALYLNDCAIVRSILSMQNNGVLAKSRSWSVTGSV